MLKWFAVTAVVGTLVLIGIFYFAYKNTTIPDANKAFEAQSTYVYYSGGKARIGRFAEQNRESIPLADIPQSMQDAAIAAEDRTFYTNSGIDPKGILRAAFSNAQGNATQGASTITQQYVKILYLSQERTLSRKVKEAFLSLKVQQEKSKEADPRGLPEHHLLRPRRLRRAGRVQRLLRQSGQEAHRARVRDARRGAQLAQLPRAPSAARRGATT